MAARRRPRPRPRLMLAAAAVLILAATPTGASASTGGHDPVAAPATPAAVSSSAVHLITGDRVVVDRFPDGRQALTVHPAGHRDGSPGLSHH